MTRQCTLVHRLGVQKRAQLEKKGIFLVILSSAVVDTMFVNIYVDTKNFPTFSHINIQHIDKRTMENKMSIIMWEAAISYATTFK